MEELGGQGITWLILREAELTELNRRSSARGEHHGHPSGGGKVTRRMVVGCHKGE